MGDWTHIAGIIRMDKAYKTVVTDWSEIIPNLTESNYDEIVKYSFNEEYNNPYIEEYKANKAHPFMYPLYKAFIKGDSEVEDDEMDIRIYKGYRLWHRQLTIFASIIPMKTAIKS